MTGGLRGLATTGVLATTIALIALHLVAATVMTPTLARSLRSSAHESTTNRVFQPSQS